jgi:hypothetical protein
MIREGIQLNNLTRIKDSLKMNSLSSSTPLIILKFINKQYLIIKNDININISRIINGFTKNIFVCGWFISFWIQEQFINVKVDLNIRR